MMNMKLSNDSDSVQGYGFLAALLFSVLVAFATWQFGSDSGRPAQFMGYGSATREMTSQGEKYTSSYIQGDEEGKARAEAEVRGEYYDPGRAASDHGNPVLVFTVFMFTLFVSGGLFMSIAQSIRDGTFWRIRS